MDRSTQTHRFAERFGLVQGIRTLAKIGFDCLDLSLFAPAGKDMLTAVSYLHAADELRRLSEDEGVYFNQVHAPFPSYVPGNEEYNQATFQLLLRSIEVSARIQAPYLIIHPVALPEAQMDFNCDFFGRLSEQAKGHAVTIAIENMFGWDQQKQHAIPNVCSRSGEFLAFIEALQLENTVACVDVGHVGLVGDKAEDMITTLGNRYVKSLHLHDNDGHTDLHTLPFLQTLNWNKIMQALRQIRYEGELTLEADRFLYGFPDEMLETAGKFMLDTVTCLRDLTTLS